MPNNVIELAKKLRAELDADDAAAIAKIINSYGKMSERLKDLVDALVIEIAGMEDPSPNKVRQLARYKRFISILNAELAQYQGYLGIEIQEIADAALSLGSSHAAELVIQSLGIEGYVAQDIPLGAVKSIVGFLDVDGALYERLTKYGEYNAKRIADMLIESVALGYGAEKTASRLVREGLGLGLTDALRMVRTSQVYAYREASRARYIANANVVFGWVWFSALIPGRTCMSCVNKHGTEHGLDEPLNDHHNGLCTMLPLTSRGNPVEQGGADWFAEQDESTQVAMMGKTKHEAWVAGKFDISQLSKASEDGVYGQMLTETPLKDLISE